MSISSCSLTKPNSDAWVTWAELRSAPKPPPKTANRRNQNGANFLKEFERSRNTVGTLVGLRSHIRASSTMAASLAEHFQYFRVELDALNWLANWEGLNATDLDRLLNRMTEATQANPRLHCRWHLG